MAPVSGTRGARLARQMATSVCPIPTRIQVQMNRGPPWSIPNPVVREDAGGDRDEGERDGEAGEPAHAPPQGLAVSELLNLGGVALGVGTVEADFLAHVVSSLWLRAQAFLRTFLR